MTIKNINCQTLKKWLENDEAVLVDVREIAEYKNKNIPRSQLIPLSNICKDSLPDCKNKKLVIHCHSGKRSLTACEKLLQEDENLEVYNLEGGICAWGDSGCEIIDSKKFFLPLDRQVQLSIGSGVLFGALLGYFVNVNFIVISAFFGGGLIFAGISGTCGLAKVLSKMPWNNK